jgi:hypothetical protein
MSPRPGKCVERRCEERAVRGSYRCEKHTAEHRKLQAESDARWIRAADTLRDGRLPDGDAERTASVVQHFAAIRDVWCDLAPTTDRINRLSEKVIEELGTECDRILNGCVAGVIQLARYVTRESDYHTVDATQEHARRALRSVHERLRNAEAADLERRFGVRRGR